MPDDFQLSRFRSELYWQSWFHQEMKRLYQEWYVAMSPHAPSDEEKVEPCVVVEDLP